MQLLSPGRPTDQPTDQPSDPRPDQPPADPELLSRLWATAVGGDEPTETAERRTQGRLETTWTREGGEPVAVASEAELYEQHLGEPYKPPESR